MVNYSVKAVTFFVLARSPLFFFADADVISNKTRNIGTRTVVISLPGDYSHRTEANPVCATIDFWPRSKVDYGRFQWKGSGLPFLGPLGCLSADNLSGSYWSLSCADSFETCRCTAQDASNLKRLTNLVRGLGDANSGITVRIGGTLEDRVVYEEGKNQRGGIPSVCIDQPSSPLSSNSFLRVPGVAVNASSWLPSNFTQGCLKRERLVALNNFCTIANCHILFGLNGLSGKSRKDAINPELVDRGHRYVGVWDPAVPYAANRTEAMADEYRGHNGGNIDGLLRDLADMDRRSGDKDSSDVMNRVVGLELGNEMAGPSGVEARFTPEEIATDYRRLKALIDELWPPTTTWDTGESGVQTKRGPRLHGAASTINLDWLKKWGEDMVLRGKGHAPPAAIPDLVFTHHTYTLGPGVTPVEEMTHQRVLSSTYLDRIRHGSSGGVAGLSRIFVKEWAEMTGESLDSRSNPLMVSEGGGAYNSGSMNVTNAFVSGFWWIDQVGQMFAYGKNIMYCRQTLIGGSYELIDKFNYTPNADYYVSSLWNRVMGRNIKDIPRTEDYSANGTSTNSYGSTRNNLRFYLSLRYSHGRMGMAITNLDATQIFRVGLSFDSESTSSSTRIVSDRPKKIWLFQALPHDPSSPDPYATGLNSRRFRINGQLAFNKELSENWIEDYATIIPIGTEYFEMTPRSYAFLSMNLTSEEMKKISTTHDHDIGASEGKMGIEFSRVRNL